MSTLFEKRFESPHPQYKVRWLSHNDSKSCGHHRRKQQTFTFFKPEAALEYAIFILNHGHTLLSVDQ